MKFLVKITLAVSIVVFSSLANCTELPSFLPKYFSTVFTIDGPPLVLLNNSAREGLEQYLYATNDKTLFLSVQNIKADSPKIKAMMSNITRSLNSEIDANGGEFVRIMPREIHAKVHNSGIKTTVFVYALPTAIQIWTFSGVRTESINAEEKLGMIRKLVNRKRYEEAIVEGNVSMGTWGDEINDYALSLLQEGKKEEALSVFRKILATSPYNFRVHLSVMENTSDPKIALDSAGIIIRNAEDSSVTEAAMKFLGKKPISINSIPVLEKGETGLQVILIALEPCDLSLLNDIATTYQKITDIPVKIRRLNEPFKLGAPDRIPYQRFIQEAIVSLSGDKVDFKGWNKEKYIKELLKVVEKRDPLKKYYANDLVQKIDKEPGQYLADPYLDWLLKTLEQYRSYDEKTMYVGITEINIYSGDNNFLFSLYESRGKSQGSILSHFMMQAKNLSEPHESRNRLIERVAKELVPASLKSLKIPRSTDPTCPYSYSNGTERLDEKTLQLSEPVKAAIAKLKLQK